MLHRTETNWKLLIPRRTLIDPACRRRSDIQQRRNWVHQLNEADIPASSYRYDIQRNGSLSTTTGQLLLRHFKDGLKTVKREPNQRSRQQRWPIWLSLGRSLARPCSIGAPALSIRDQSGPPKFAH